MLTSACSTSSTGLSLFDDSVEVEHLMYTTSFMYPESQGKTFGFNMKLGYAGTDTVKLIDDIDDISIATNTSLAHGAAPTSNFALGIISHLDVYYDNGIGLKLQIWGSGADDAKKGNFSIALLASDLSFNTKTTTNDTTGSVKEAEAKIIGSGKHYEVLVGYRTTDETLVYTGPFYTETKVDKIEIFQTNNTDFTYRGEVAEGEGNNKGLKLGIYNQKQKNWFGTLNTGLGIEAAYSRVEWKDTFNSPEKEYENDGFHIGGVVTLGW